MPLLIITSNDAKISQRFLVREERFAIGRLRSSAVPIRDKSVSKTHVMISRTPTGYIFQDLFSRNGTYLNEERCDSGVLRSGDVLRLGRINITFLIDEDLERAATPGEAPPPRSSEESADTQAIPVKPAGGPPGALAPGRDPSVASLPRASADRVLQRDLERRMRFLVALGTGAVGLLIGFLVARIDSVTGPEMKAAHAPGPPAAGPREAADPDSAADAESREAAPALDPRGQELEVLDSEEEARVEEIAAELREDLRRPYSDPQESRRVLFRLFLDLVARTPTRAEERDLLPLGHEERWRRIAGLAASETGGRTEEFKRYLGREPAPLEIRAVGKGIAPGAEAGTEDGAPGPGELEAGLLLTASKEYRSADFRRPRSLGQKAGSLIVDLLDRPPSSAEESQDLEKALERFPCGKVARVLALSSEGCRALPASTASADPRGIGTGPQGEDGVSLREWVLAEIQRFLLRSPSEAEIEKVMEEVRKSEDGPRRLRIALASLAEYRRY